jgi:serine/threonine protein kinase
MIIANKYKLLKPIGEGAFGQIYEAENIRNREKIAIKSEPIDSQFKMLKHETKIYQELDNCTGFPQVKWFGIHQNSYFMALTLLGPSLKDFKKSLPTPQGIPSSNPFSLFNIKSLSKKMVERLEFIHSKGILHRDIKPDNFLLKDDELYLIDFGLCKKWKTNEGSHIKERKERTPLGTSNYISVNVHNGIDPSRRDDMESVGYIILFLLLKSMELPWSNCQNHQEIAEEKINLLQKNIPEFLKNYLCYCRSLGFYERPNYEYLKNLLLN